MAGDVATSAFAGDPQPVEIHHRGTWYVGELLGWRFDEAGRCLARVRCVVDGLRHSTWKELADLRLPEPAASESAASEPVTVPAGRWAAVGRHETAAPSRVPAPSPGRPRRPDGDTEPHVLLVDRNGSWRPPAPRPRGAPRTPSPADHPGSA